MAPDDPRLIFLPESEVEGHGGPCHAIDGKYWAVHPERGLIFLSAGQSIIGAFPQCRHSEEFAKLVVERRFPWAEVRFFPRVVCPVE